MRRGPYGGAVAYFSFSGNLDSCITIRTIVLANDRASVQAGAGIVYDSVPSSEYDECVNKSAALRQAIAMAKGVIPSREDGEGSRRASDQRAPARDPSLRSG